jgi:hypothetical protein
MEAMADGNLSGKKTKQTIHTSNESPLFFVVAAFEAPKIITVFFCAEETMAFWNRNGLKDSLNQSMCPERLHKQGPPSGRQQCQKTPLVVLEYLVLEGPPE